MCETEISSSYCSVVNKGVGRVRDAAQRVSPSPPPQLCSQELHSPALAVGTTEKHMRRGWVCVCISWFLHSCLNSEATGSHFKLQRCKKCVPLAKESNIQSLIHMHKVP